MRATTFLLLVSSFYRVQAQVPCENGNDAYCEKLLYIGSQCRNGFCSNPFEKGCLHTLLNHGDDNDKGTEDDSITSTGASATSKLARRLKSAQGIRACNSEDKMPDAIEQGICVDYAGTFSGMTPRKTSDVGNIYTDYTEVRILSQNWESAFFASWILQILLSEVLRVPTTIESGMKEAKLNFYSPTNDFGYGEYNDFGALARANELPQADCRLMNTEENEDGGEGEYQSCGHVIPEFWGGGDLADLYAKQRDGLVDPPEGLGAIGQQGLFVTKFTAESDPTVLNLLGIAGEANRRKLAETFLRPTTWKDYCDLVSPNNCTTSDDVAQHAPTDEADYERMFVAGSYTGHFRATEENDCDTHPDTCTGHVGDFPNGWISFVKPQMYYHNIALASSGKEPGSNGYTYSQLVEMYAAANATRSNLMIMWWTPEAMYSTYVGTNAEMQRVVLPTPTQECVDNRIPSTHRFDYEDDPMKQYGDPAGACDEAPQLLQKIIASGLYQATYQSGIGEAKRSPAYDAIKAVKITELQFGSILKSWINRNGDTYGFDPRLATCVWARNNLDLLHDFIPRSHPRAGKEENRFESPVFYVALSFGGVATVITIITSIITYRRRNGYVMRFSQVEFLLLLLLGILMVSVGSVLLATEPTNATCIASVWLLSLGNTLALVPLIVKVGAMNRLMTAAKRMKRIILTKRHLFGTVAFFVSIIVIVLVLWSILDPPQRRGEFNLTDDTNDFGEYMVTINYYCSSDSDIWRYVVVVWDCILLLCATVLAFQTRNLQAGFSETSVLAIMIYSRFFFEVLRVVSYLLEGTLSESYLASLRSLMYSLDAIVTLCVYFVPKLLTDDEKFYDLTHRAAGKSSVDSSDGRGSVLTMTGTGLRGSKITHNPSCPFNSNIKNKDDESSETSEMAPDSAHTAKKSSKPKPVERDVLRDGKVSWGGACMTMIINDGNSSHGANNDSDASSSRSEAEGESLFEKPVDVLKDGRDSWGGGHITMFIQEDDDEDYSDEENPGTKQTAKEDTKMASIAEVSVAETKKSVLPPASLPKNSPTRFNYAASRITLMREKHASDIELDDSFGDEE